MRSYSFTSSEEKNSSEAFVAAVAGADAVVAANKVSSTSPLYLKLLE